MQFRVQTLVCAFDCQRNRSLKAELLTACLKCISTLETMNASESHRDANFVAAAIDSSSLIDSPRLETGVRLAICDSLSLACCIFE